MFHSLQHALMLINPIRNIQSHSGFSYILCLPCQNITSRLQSSPGSFLSELDC